MGLSSDDKQLLRVLFGGSLLDYREAKKIIRRQPSSFSESDKKALVKLVYLKSAVYPGSVDRAKFLINGMSSAILKRFLSQHFDGLVERQYKLSVSEEYDSVQTSWGAILPIPSLLGDAFGDISPAVFEGEGLYSIVIIKSSELGYLWTIIFSSAVTTTDKNLQLVVNLPEEQTFTFTVQAINPPITVFTESPTPSFDYIDYLSGGLVGRDVGVDLSLVDAE